MLQKSRRSQPLSSLIHNVLCNEMGVKDSKLRVQTLPPIVQPVSKGRRADDFRRRYLASRCLPRLGQCSAL